MRHPPKSGTNVSCETHIVNSPLEPLAAGRGRGGRSPPQLPFEAENERAGRPQRFPRVWYEIDPEPADLPQNCGSGRHNSRKTIAFAARAPCRPGSTRGAFRSFSGRCPRSPPPKARGWAVVRHTRPLRFHRSSFLLNAGSEEPEIVGLRPPIISWVRAYDW